MDTLPLTIYEEIGKYLDVKGFVSVASLSKGLRVKVLSSNIKIKGAEFFFSTKEKEYNLYQSYKRHFTEITAVFEINSGDYLLTKVIGSCICSEIQTLNLYDCNRITDQGVEEISKLVNLRSLDLSHCYQITDKSAKCISKLVNLQNLNLFGCCQITDEGIGEIASNLVNLRCLNLSHCYEITVKGFKSLTNLNLQTLYVSSVKITDGFKYLANLTSLQTLYLLSYNIGQGYEGLCNLTSLHTLSLFSCNVTDQGIKNLAINIPSLRILTISHCNGITDQGIKDLACNIPTLKTLFLSHCNGITEQGIKCLVDVTTNIRMLELSGYKFSNETVKMLRDRFELFYY